MKNIIFRVIPCILLILIFTTPQAFGQSKPKSKFYDFGEQVIDGEINSTSDVRIIRDGSIIYTGKVSTIFREKNQVKQVTDGQECGITVKDYMDFQKNDTIEAFSVTSTERSI